MYSADALGTAMQRFPLKELHLNDNMLDASFLSKLASGLQSPACLLQSLVLDGNTLGDSTGTLLGKVQHERVLV
jgi:hypothetical protein